MRKLSLKRDEKLTMVSLLKTYYVLEIYINLTSFSYQRCKGDAIIVTISNNLLFGENNENMPSAKSLPFSDPVSSSVK